MTQVLRAAPAAVLVALVTSALGCGDNSKQCGEGTIDEGGRCVPDSVPPTTCTDGTIFDEPTNSCVLDPAACQGGTVLINRVCQDPTAGLTPDLEEGAEPNGYGVGGEPSATPAGLVTLASVGEPGVILHGRITPRADRDDDGVAEPDYDTYLVDVTGPTLLDVTADGVHGLAAGFLAVGAPAGLERWARFGINLTGDTTHRQLFLPTAGRYAIAIADTRSLVLGAPVGDATTEYYVTLARIPLPTPTPITLSAGAAKVTDTIAPLQTKFYTAPLGTGLNEVSLASEHDDLTGGLVVDVENALHGAAAERKSTTVDRRAALIVGGIDATDTTLIVIDQEIDTTGAPVPFELRLTSRTAAALSTSGGTAMQDNVLDQSPYPSSFDDLAEFFFDAAAAGQLIGLDLVWNNAVDGVLLDEYGEIASRFSWDPAFGAGAFFDGWGSYAWDRYRGVFRAPAAGRYYFVVNNPAAAAGGDLVATSTLGTITATPLAFAAPLTGVAINPFNASVFDYPGDAEAWQEATLAAGGGAGGATTLFYDAASTSGRLTPLVLGDQRGGPDFTTDGDGIALLRVASPGTAASDGRIMLGEPQHLLAVVATTSAAGTFDLGIAARTTTTDAIAAGAMQTHAGVPLAPLEQHRYLVTTTARNLVTITVHPTLPAMDLRLTVLAPDEASVNLVDATGAGADESVTMTVGARGYVAVRVENTSGGGGSYDLVTTVAAPFYAVTAGLQPWTNICPTGTDVTPDDRDDGLTAPITLPTGFTLFSGATTAIRISTNGWLTFDPTTPISANQSLAEQPLPNTTNPNSVIAAYWDDLTNVRVCTKVDGTRLIVQWRGELFRATASAPAGLVGAQAILDTADDSIELVYAPYTTATGASASIGVENATGSVGTQVLLRTPSLTPGSAIKLVHP